VKFFHTGDLGVLVEGRFLKVTGRIKELYKLENGKYVTPVPLEDDLCRSQFILQCMVYGANRPFNVALIVPDFVQVPPPPPPPPPSLPSRPYLTSSQLSAWVKKTPGLSGLDLSSPEAQRNVFQNETVIKLFNSEVCASSLSLPPPHLRR
jgi:long-subunit acyl-CoA synthetase (AMP-forming)